MTATYIYIHDPGPQAAIWTEQHTTTSIAVQALLPRRFLLQTRPQAGPHEAHPVHEYSQTSVIYEIHQADHFLQSTRWTFALRSGNIEEGLHIILE